MPAKKLPDTDEERVRVLEILVDLEENAAESVISSKEIHDIKCFLLAYERANICVQQAMDDESTAEQKTFPLFQKAQLYISHFIQVLYMAIIRQEIKAESLAYYGLNDSDDFTLPDLSTREAVTEWGERLINGEAVRIAQGGSPIYNPTITKVKVHYDIFKEAIHSLKIYHQSTHRNQESLEELQDKADNLIWNAWTKFEFAFGALPPEERNEKYSEYGIQFHD